MNFLITADDPVLKALAWRLQAEGDILVEENPDFILTNSFDTYKKHPGIHVIGGELKLSSQDIKDLGFDHSTDNAIVEVFRWRDRNGWGRQSIFGIPLRGMMNENLGLNYRTGLLTRYFGGRYDGFFENPSIEDFLQRLFYSGLVIFGLTKDLKVSYIKLGLGDFHLYSIIEGLEGKLSDFFFRSDAIRLKESWVCSILISRYPFPMKEYDERVHLEGLTKSALRHFYPFDVDGFSASSLYTEQTALGVSSAWGLSTAEASRRAIQTARNLHVPAIQYRTDAASEARRVLGVFHSIQDMSSDDQPECSLAQQWLESSEQGPGPGRQSCDSDVA